MINQNKRFTLVARAKSFTHAFRGLFILFKSTPNFWIHILATILAIILGILFNLSSIEWCLIVIVIGIVLISETFNTAIEIDINLTSPDFHPYAKDTKDVAAGAVLLSSILALIIGAIIFIPKIILFFN